MSRPYKMTEDYAKTLVLDFYKTIWKSPLTGGTLNYSAKMDLGRATLLFTPLAYMKQAALVRETDTEIGWHGVAKRSEENDHTYIVEDILVYPQKVTGSTINPDQGQYNEWMDALDDDTFNNLRMFGHSHVNMGTFASGVDEGYQKDLVAQLGQDMFEIFLILNKKGEHWQRIVDLKTNIVYEKEDIDIGLTECGFDYKAFVDDAAGKLTRDTVTHTATPASSSAYTGAKPQATKCWSYQDAARAKKQQVQQPEQTQFQYNDPDDDEVVYETPYGWYGRDGKFHSYSKNY